MSAQLPTKVVPWQSQGAMQIQNRRLNPKYQAHVYLATYSGQWNESQERDGELEADIHVGKVRDKTQRYKNQKNVHPMSGEQYFNRLGPRWLAFLPKKAQEPVTTTSSTRVPQ